MMLVERGGACGAIGSRTDDSAVAMPGVVTRPEPTSELGLFRSYVGRVRSRAVAERFIRLLTSSTIYRPDGRIETTKDLAVWTLAHRGYSGGGRLDVWVYRTEAEALAAGALLAMECGLDEDPQARRVRRRQIPAGARAL
jgi:hypothetical protein